MLTIFLSLWLDLTIRSTRRLPCDKHGEYRKCKHSLLMTNTFNFVKLWQVLFFLYFIFLYRVYMFVYIFLCLWVLCFYVTLHFLRARFIELSYIQSPTFIYTLTFLDKDMVLSLIFLFSKSNCRQQLLYSSAIFKIDFEVNRYSRDTKVPKYWYCSRKASQLANRNNKRNAF